MADITSNKFTIKLINNTTEEAPGENSTKIIVRKGFDETLYYRLYSAR